MNMLIMPQLLSAAQGTGSGVLRARRAVPGAVAVPAAALSALPRLLCPGHCGAVDAVPWVPCPWQSAVRGAWPGQPGLARGPAAALLPPWHLRPVPGPHAVSVGRAERETCPAPPRRARFPWRLTQRFLLCHCLGRAIPTGSSFFCCRTTKSLAPLLGLLIFRYLSVEILYSSVLLPALFPEYLSSAPFFSINPYLCLISFQLLVSSLVLALLLDYLSV